jgi:DNA-binding CsgD family transcriptional regulator
MLSAKERWVLYFTSQGLTPEQVGRLLRLSPFAVRVFLENAQIKLSVQQLPS